MRQRRWKVRGDAVGFYHCISRVVDRRFIFEVNEKEQFVHWMTAYAEFCGVQVLTYCVMSNHFHILLAVPERPKALPNDPELLRLYALVHGEDKASELRQEIEHWPEVQKQEWRDGLYAQMWDLSSYMKLIKQRFSQWYNRRMNRKGTLWEERFKSVLVEGSREALGRIAAYIDLNPIRARLVEDPMDYRWCGYAAAVGGKRFAKEGIATLIHIGQGGSSGGKGTITEALAIYRCFVFGEGMVEGIQAEGGPAIRPGIDPERVRQVLAQKGQLSWAEYARCQVRYFTDGAAIGSKAWVNGTFQKYRERFGPLRKDGARKLEGLKDQPLFAIRDLRLNRIRLNWKYPATSSAQHPRKEPLSGPFVHP